MTYQPSCPLCNQADKTYKVSLLYMAASARLHHRDQVGEAAKQPAEPVDLDGLLEDIDGVDAAHTQTLRRLVTALEPPTGEKRVTRQIHPDGFAVFFCLMTVVILYQVADSQRQYFAVIIAIFAGSLLLYLLARRNILERYEAKKLQEQEKNRQVESAITRWMGLYFCIRDTIVFIPKDQKYAPLDQMDSFLRGELDQNLI